MFLATDLFNFIFIYLSFCLFQSKFLFMCDHKMNPFLSFSPTRHITPCCISIVHINVHKNWQRSAIHSQEKMKASILFLIIWLFIQGLTCTIWWVDNFFHDRLWIRFFPSTSKNTDSLCPSLHYHEWLVILTGNIGVNLMENLSPLTDVPELPSILVVTVYVSQQTEISYIKWSATWS